MTLTGTPAPKLKAAWGSMPRGHPYQEMTTHHIMYLVSALISLCSAEPFHLLPLGDSQERKHSHSPVLLLPCHHWSKSPSSPLQQHRLGKAQSEAMTWGLSKQIRLWLCLALGSRCLRELVGSKRRKSFLSPSWGAAVLNLADVAHRLNAINSKSSLAFAWLFYYYYFSRTEHYE